VTGLLQVAKSLLSAFRAMLDKRANAKLAAFGRRVAVGESFLRRQTAAAAAGRNCYQRCNGPGF